jgi:hypothetical protein
MQQHRRFEGGPMTFVLAVVAGIVGLVVGWAAAAFAALLYASATGMSNFEGAAGMLAVFGIGPIGGLIGLVLGIWLVLRRGRAGGRSFGSSALRGVLVLVAIAAVIAGGFGVMYMTRDVINPDGPAPQLAFELRLPAGLPPPDASKPIEVELHTQKNRMPGSLAVDANRRDGDRIVIPGRVDLYFRTSWRMLTFKRQGEPERLFQLKLAANPGHGKTLGAWQKVDYIAMPGETETRRPGPGDDYELRYRVVWVGQD